MAVGRRGDKLVIDFRCTLPNDQRVRCVEYEGDITKKNQARVKSKWKAIEYHVKTGTFDYLKFFPNGSKAKHFQKTVTDITLSEVFEIWLSQKTITFGTQRNYERHFTNHIEPYFGGWSIGNIEEHDVLVFRKLLQGKNLSESTVNQYMITLCMVLLFATKRKLIPEYPCAGIGKLDERPSEIDPFSFEELKYWLSYLEKYPNWRDLIIFWSRTGLRPGELYALKWEHIDYFNRKTLIRENRRQNGSTGLPKTKSSIRDVDLKPIAIDALHRQEARTGLMGKFVWLTHTNRQWTVCTMRQKWRHYLRLAGLKYRPQKQMRHTFATLHIAAGESITWVSKMLGHTDVETTLKRYNRFIPNLTRDDGSAFERVMDKEKRNEKKDEKPVS